MSSTIEAEIDSHWHQQFAEGGHDVPPRSQFREIREQIWRENQTVAIEKLQPWLGLFEFGLEWLSYVHIALSSEDASGPLKPEFRVPWALVGSASAFGWSLRQLCLQGFDTPARALLRSYSEALFLCIAVLYDEALGAEYFAAQDDPEVKNFWHTAASPKNLHGRIVEIERELGFESDVRRELTEWRRSEYEVLAQSAHISYVAAVMTCRPVSIEDEDLVKFGILGTTSAHSHRTLSYATGTTWYFSLLATRKLLGKTAASESLLVADEENELHVRIAIYQNVLSKLTISHWGE